MTMAPELVFAASIAFLFYVTFGYPLLLHFLARYRARPVYSKPFRATVSFILPVHNGEKFIADKLRSILDLEYPGELVEIVVVSDGSTDATESLVEGFAQHGVRLIRKPRGGKPAALNAGIAVATGEILVFTDVRQSLAQDSLQILIDCFADNKIGVASGNLVIRHGAAKGEAGVGLYRLYETWIRDSLSRIDSIFGAVGSYYAMRRELAVMVPEETLLDDVYLPLAAFFRGYRSIVELRALMFDLPTTLDMEFQRKVRTLAGNYQMLRDYPALMGPRNRMWFHFMSYKFARLLLPYALLATALSSLFLPWPWAQLAIAGQLCFYLAAIADPYLPEEFPLRRITSPIRTFLVLAIATVAALRVFFVSPRSLWKETRIVH